METFHGIWSLWLDFSFKANEIAGVNNKQKKIKLFKEKIKKQLPSLPFILTGDIMVDIDFTVPAYLRFETDKMHDLDNLIKPFLDVLSGKDGIYIDDTQIVCLNTRIIETKYSDEDFYIRIRIDFEDILWALKTKLFFVQYYKALCFPFEGNLLDPNFRVEDLLKLLILQLKRRLLIEKSKQDIGIYEWGFHSIQRSFHITRIQNKGFPIYSIYSLISFILFYMNSTPIPLNFTEELQKEKKTIKSIEELETIINFLEEILSNVLN